MYMDFIDWIKPSKQSNINELKNLIHSTFDNALKKNNGDIHQIFNQFSNGKDVITRKVYIYFHIYCYLFVYIYIYTFIYLQQFLKMIREYFPESKELTDNDIISIMYEIDIDNNQVITYSEFIKYFFPELMDDKPNSGRTNTSNIPKIRSSNEILKQLRILVGRKAVDHDYREIFEYLDRDKSGNIEIKEFYNGLKKLGMDFTEDECRIVFEEIDRDSSGSV